MKTNLKNFFADGHLLKARPETMSRPIRVAETILPEDAVFLANLGNASPKIVESLRAIAEHAKRAADRGDRLVGALSNISSDLNLLIAEIEDGEIEDGK